MIIGNGDIASVLTDREDRLYFASGVSNSQETRESEYEREIALLMKQDKWRHIVYFSSLSIFYTDTRYAQHKRQMEKLVKKNFGHFTIIRIGNITWGVNPHTIINYMKAHRDAEVKDVYRYIVTKEEFLHWVNLIPEWSCEMNIPGRMMKVKDIIKEYV
jgi:hypothetical protein